MLDKLSEKFLRYVIDNQDKNNAITNIQANHSNIGIPYDFITDICKELEDKGYIHAIPCDDGVHSVILRHKGAAYFDEKKTAKLASGIKYWLPIAISNLIAVASLVISILK